MHGLRVKIGKNVYHLILIDFITFKLLLKYYSCISHLLQCLQLWDTSTRVELF